VLALSSGCGPDDLSLTVEICGDVRVPQDIDAVRVAVLKSDRSPATGGVLTLLECEPSERVLALPQHMSLDPDTGDVWVVLEGLKNEIVVATYEQRIKLEEGDNPTITMGLTRDCLGFLSCALGQTCVDGECVIVEYGGIGGICAGGAVEGGTPDDPGPYCDDEIPSGEGEGEGEDAGAGDADAG
jgi:hypothetical protein